MIETILRRLANLFALIGGCITLVLVAMSLVSLIGRKLFSAPILGDIEILEMSIAVAVSLFLPLCEMRDNHIRVDILGEFFPEAVNRLLLTICHLLLALMAGFVFWRNALFALSSFSQGDTSTMLAVPLWIPQGLMLPGFGLLALCALYRARLAWTTAAPHGEVNLSEKAVH